MAITNKGSRRIVVDATPYHWIVRPRPSYCQGLAWTSLSFAVECEAGGGSRLHVNTDMARPDNWIEAQAGTITPSVVAQAIRQALRQGWSPAQRAGVFELAIRLAPASPAPFPAPG